MQTRISEVAVIEGGGFMIDQKVWNEQLEKLAFYYDIPGLVVGVGNGSNGLLYTNAIGKKNLKTGENMEVSDIFHMASVTKLFVGTAVMQLWEQGRCDLSEPLASYLPWFHMADHRYRRITVRQLLTHTAGMPDCDDYEWDKPQTDDQALRRFVESEAITGARLLWDPEDGRFAYSNIGYELLGDLIAALSGRSFEDYIHRYIFQPLGMRDSSLLTFQRDLNTLCAPHQKNQQNQIEIAPHFPYNRAHGPSSTLTSNVYDIEKWAKAHLNQTILKPETYDTIWQEQALVPNNGEQICLSWFKRQQLGYDLYGHEGTDDGFRASFWICPSLDYFSCVTANLSGAPVKKITRQIFEWYLGAT